MSAGYQGKDPLELAKQAEQDLGITASLQGHGVDGTSRNARGASDSTAESGVDESVRQKFPSADVKYGSAASGAGDNREIPLDEGGSINPRTGQPTKARDFEGPGGLEEKDHLYAKVNPGSDDVRGNVR